MVTGIEAAGLTLAILPLLVNQLDGDVRGLEKAKGFRSYRREVKGYMIGLSAQYAILLNTLELFLEDVVDDHDEIARLIKNPTGDEWTMPEFQKKLRHKLDRNYDVFVNTTAELSGRLDELSKQLGLENAEKLETESITYTKAIKFRMIFKRVVYDDLLAKINSINQILRTLVEQAHQRGQIKWPSRRKHNLRAYQAARKHARALYNAIVQGRCWKCVCQSWHSVFFQLGAKSVQYTESGKKSARSTQFTMILSTRRMGDHVISDEQWHEVEAIPYIIDPPTSSTSPSDASSSTATRVRFLTVDSDRNKNNTSTPLCALIHDLCSALIALGKGKATSDLIGYISDELDAAKRYNMRFLRELQQGVQYQSLHEILDVSRPSTTCSSTELNRRDGLFLATILANTVLQFHGSWLKQEWTIQDIMFARDDHDSGSIANRILFPLALALIELSLGQPISALYRPGDQELRDDLTQRQTALRFLDNVYWESGSSYGDVVKECLFWSPSAGQEFEDEKFEESVYEAVVSPLLKDFNHFEGRSYSD